MLKLSVDLSGPALSAHVKQQVEAGIDAGLEKVVLKGQALVQAQLTPGHGVVTGHLRRSVHGGMVRSLHGQIDAGLEQQGANVNYATFVESGHHSFGGYHMFASAAGQLQNADLRGMIVDEIVRRLS